MPIPSGMPTPVNTRRTPKTSRAPLTSEMIAAIGPPRYSVMAFQLTATVATSPTAPAAISPMPIGSATPVRVRMMPSTSNALLTSAVIAPMGPCKAVWIVSQFAATDVASPIAPAIIRPRPIGTFAPLKASTAPRTSRDAESIAVTAPIGP